ncbi:hypothetical protein Tco_1021175 [Tanacetum coccineum]
MEAGIVVVSGRKLPEEVANVRHNALFRIYMWRTQWNAVAIQIHAHDPLRFVVDMLGLRQWSISYPLDYPLRLWTSMDQIDAPLQRVKAAPAKSVFVDSLEESFGDMIKIKVDVWDEMEAYMRIDRQLGLVQEELESHSIGY